jgi:hypothetical protein
MSDLEINAMYSDELARLKELYRWRKYPEEPPEKTGRYLVTVQPPPGYHSDPRDNESFTNIDYFNALDGGFGLYTKAWMPLPKAYKTAPPLEDK